MTDSLSSETLRLSADLQTLWTLVCASLVLFMQAGFCCLEAGSVRHKNSINVAVKNVVDLCISFPAFFVVGYALMFGADHYGVYGTPTLFLSDLAPSDVTGFFYQAAFCSTAATIVSGGVAERCRFLPYVFVTLVTSTLIYPLYGHLVWGGGYLSQLGFHDFAGSSVVHMVGAGVTLAGIQVLGPRKDRFDGEGNARAIPASSMPMIALGVVILLFGWVGFNGGSAPLGPSTAVIITNTLLAACFGGLGALLLTWAYRGLAAVDLILNGVLGGLVAITACADVVSLQAASLVGLAGGAVVVLATRLLEWLRLDDAVGAIPVHGFAGMTGILLTAVFAESQYLTDAGMTRVQFLGVQATGLGICALWSYAVGYVLWRLVGFLTSLRVGPVEETVGMNFSEHQVDSPVEALTQSLLHIARGKPLRDVSFDHVPDSQFEALALVVRDLMQSRDSSLQRAGTWSQDLDAMSGTLDLNQRIGREALETYRDELGKIDETLSHLGLLLSEGVSRSGLAVAADSIVNLRRRLSLVRERAPAAFDSWDQVHQVIERLDHIAGAIRGDIRDVH